MIDKWLQLRHELGWQGIGGVVLLIVGLIISNVALRPIEERVAQAREQVESQDQHTELGAMNGSGSPTAEMEKFYDFFESGKELTDYLAKIYSVAQANSLQLRQGDYKVINSKGERITQYQITLPVTGGYNQIRGFAAQVLDAMPTLSLDMIRFERKQSNDPVVDAEIIFTLYYVEPS